MTITLSENVAPSTLERLLDYLKREQVPYVVQPNGNDDDVERTSAIRERLRHKYVTTGAWATMDDEDRQDASLLEGMLYDRGREDRVVYSEADTAAFYKNLKKELYAR